jgi:biotin carboxylase
MTQRSRPLFAVLYDAGAVPAGEVGAGLADLGDIVFLVPSGSAHVEQMLPVMELLGEITTLSGRAEEDAALVRALAPDGILTFCEDMIRPAAALAAAAGLPGQSVRTAELFTDKGLQRQVLREAGIDGTRTRVVRTLDDWKPALAEVGLPSIVKPVTGSRSKDAYALRTPDDVRAAHARLAEIAAGGDWAPFILEEFLEGRPSEPFGDYVSVESVCTPSGITHLVLTGKSPVMPPFRGTGRIWPSHLPPDEEREIFDLVTRALQAVGCDSGYAHSELKLTPDGPRLIELNGRLSGHVNMMSRESCGLDLVRLGALVALGEEPYLPTFDFGGKVHFQYNNLSPLAPCTLEAVHGAEAVREIPGVTAYRNFVRPGVELPGGTTTLTLDTLSGVCDGHEAVMRTIDAARAALTFEFRFADGVHSVNGLELARF